MTDGTKKEDSWAGELVENTSSKFNQLGTESNVSLAYMQGVEQHRPTMRMPLGHGCRLRRRRIRNILKDAFSHIRGELGEIPNKRREKVAREIIQFLKSVNE